MRGRWILAGRSQYDLESSEALNYRVFLTRNDLNWSIRAGVQFDNSSQDTSFIIEFEPRFGGLFSPRSDRFGGSSVGRNDYLKFY